MSEKSKIKTRILEGIVTSAKMDKTIVVEVKRKFLHPIYKKAVIKRKRFKAHDEKNGAKEGDRVKITNCRPYSKEKRFRLIGVVK